jgi:hypothetical protein
MTFTIKRRGTPSPIAAEYLCPKHGRFDIVVARDENGDPPGEVKCERWLTQQETEADGHQWYGYPTLYCGEWSELVLSAPRVKKLFTPTAVVKGKADDRPTPLHMDHSAVADGKITMGEWREQRENVWRDHRIAEEKKAIS